VQVCATGSLSLLSTLAISMVRFLNPPNGTLNDPVLERKKVN